MPKKKIDEETAAEKTVETAVELGVEEVVVAAPAEEALAVEAAPSEDIPADTEQASDEKPKKKAAKSASKRESESPAVEAVSTVKVSKRAEKVGIVASDKMTNTVTVRVDRLVKHPIYRKYVKKRKKFMAHDEMGAKIGDKVKIVETRPMSARKRWRVVEILHKAEL